MLKPVSLMDFGKTDLIPQAIIKRPASYFEKQGIRFLHGEDELDAFDAAAFFLDGLPFALMHRLGYPEDTTTVYLTRDFGHDVTRITAIIRQILAALNLSPDSLIWERRDNPDL